MTKVGKKRPRSILNVDQRTPPDLRPPKLRTSKDDAHIFVDVKKADELDKVKKELSTGENDSETSLVSNKSVQNQFLTTSHESPTIISYNCHGPFSTNNEMKKVIEDHAEKLKNAKEAFDVQENCQKLKNSLNKRTMFVSVITASGFLLSLGLYLNFSPIS